MRIGNVEGSNLKTTGVWSVGSVGKLRRARSTSCNTSTAACPMSAPQLNWIRTDELPSTVLDVTMYRLGAEDTACSTGRVTCASISSGATLGQLVETTTVGSVTLGSKSTGRRVRQIA